ncbi:hypothetical protein N7451_004933 [Penicillium sp. IBT 35674x]|nr:hypothetical protein N7451_004933 [Penicillium sp. IBT 35674x]
MSDDGSAPVYEASVSTPNNNGTASLAVDLRGDNNYPALPTYSSKERDFIDRLPSACSPSAASTISIKFLD